MRSWLGGKRLLAAVLVCCIRMALAEQPALWAQEVDEPEEDQLSVGEAAPPEQTDPAEEAEQVDPDEPPGMSLVDRAPDALRDPIIGKFVKRRVLIDRPGFSVETGGRIQVQYYDADSDDPENEDEIFLRRVRPFLLGHIGKNWTWKLEGELSSDIEAGSVDFDQLDVRDMFLRYEGFKSPRSRLTLGNQKAPFSRDFLAPNTHLLLIERAATGQASAGVPGRVFGVHFRGTTAGDKLAYWANAGALGHQPDVDRLRFDTLIFGDSSLNQGLIVAGRLDLQPRGAVTFSDSDAHTPELRSGWSLAGYVWENDGSKNRFTDAGVALDPERADLDSATGIEVSGGLRGRGITLDWQYNRLLAETVVEDFTGGIYVGGETTMETASLEGGYWLARVPIELGGALNRLDADGYAEPWDTATLVLNLHGLKRFTGKIQITHAWIRSRFGIPGEDFREVRLQIQYLW